MVKRRKIIIVLFLILFIKLFTNSAIYGATIISKDGKWEYFIKNNVVCLCQYLGTDGTVEIPKTIDGYEVKYIESFIGNKVIEHLKIPSTIKKMGNLFGAFQGCKNLRTVEIEEGELKSIGMFDFMNCTELTEISIPSNIKSISNYAFMSCKNLEKFNISSGIENIGIEAFSGCEKLSQISIDKDNRNFTMSDGVLYNNNKTQIIFYPLTKADKEYSIPESVEKLEKYNIENSYLEKINISRNLTKIENGAFSICDNLKEIEVEEQNSYYSDANGVLFNKAKDSLMCYPAGKLENSYIVPNTVNTIETNAFDNNDSLKVLTIKNTVKNIKEGAINYCDNLVICCNEGSTAQNFAIENNIKYQLIDSNTKAIKFKDKKFYNYMKDYLNSRYSVIESYNDKENTIVITKENILKVDLINIEGKGIEDLEGIENFENLVHLYASENKIENLEPLRNLNKIQILLLNKNNIKNIEALANLTEIRELQLDNNQITNINALENLNYLERVFISNNNVTDVLPLNNLQNLRVLVMKNNYYIEDKTDYNIVKGDKIKIKLPSVFKYAKQEKSLLYTLDDFISTNCKLEQDTIMLNTDVVGDNIATIAIKSGNASETIYKVKYIVKEYNFLKESSQYELKNNYLTKINPQTKIEDLKKAINEEYQIKVYKNQEKIADNNTIVNTNMKVIVSIGEQQKGEYILVIKGDCNGDGEADIKDILQINKHRLNKVLLNGANLEAGDVNNDGKVDIFDILKINKYRLKKSNL